MPITHVNGKTILECGGDIFTIVKLLGLILIPRFETSNCTTMLFIQINILEAIIDDIITNKTIQNAVFGINVMLLLPIMEKYKKTDCEGFKLWCILYFIWIMKFCKNKGFGTQESFAQNVPALVTTLLSFGYTAPELISYWANARRNSISTWIIDKLG